MVSRRTIGQLEYVGIDEFRRQTWGLLELFSSATVIELVPPAHSMSRIVFSDHGGSETARVIVREVANGRFSAVTTFDEAKAEDARDHMMRSAGVAAAHD